MREFTGPGVFPATYRTFPVKAIPAGATNSPFIVIDPAPYVFQNIINQNTANDKDNTI